MTVKYFPKTVEERQEIEARQMVMYAMWGAACVVPGLPAAMGKAVPQ